MRSILQPLVIGFYALLSIIILSIPWFFQILSMPWWLLACIFIPTSIRRQPFASALIITLAIVVALGTTLIFPPIWPCWILCYLFIATRQPATLLPASLTLMLLLIASYVPMMVTDLFAFAIAAGMTLILHSCMQYYFYTNAEGYCLRQIAKLQQQLFSSIQHPHYHTVQYLLERRIALEKYHCQQALAQLQSHKLHAQYQQLYLLLLDAGEIRFRVSDSATFALCQQELHSIDQMLANVLQTIKKHQSIKQFPLSVRIKSFEDSFHQVLKISAPEPLVFLIFIDSLIRINDLLGVIGEERSICR